MEEGKKKSRSSKSKKVDKSGVRTKFLIESLRNNYYELREENDRLRGLVKSNLAQDDAAKILDSCFDLNAPREKVDNIDDLASKLAGSGIDEDEDDGAVGF